MSLKFKNIKMIQDQDWDELVQITYKRPYCFQQQEGCRDKGIFTFSVPDKAEDFKNDTIPEIINHDKRGISFQTWLKRNPTEPLKEYKVNQDWYIELWWKRNFYPDFQTVVNDLYNKGLIEKGEYTINIDI